MSRNEADAGIGRPTTDDDDIKRMSARMRLQRPRRAAARMASGFVRGESGAAQSDGVVILQDAIDMSGRKVRQGAIKVCISAGLENGHVASHDHEAGMGFTEHLRGASNVIEVGVADEEDFGIAPVEAELFHTMANLRRRRGEIGVDEDVAFRRDDKIGGEIARADVVEVARDAEGSDWGGPRGGHGVAGGASEGEEADEQPVEFHGRPEYGKR